MGGGCTECPATTISASFTAYKKDISLAGSVLDSLKSWLTERDTPFETMEHEPVFTSEEAARVRGVSLSSGAKALICKAGSEMVMIVMPANLRLASKRIRKERKLKSLRFASKEEVDELTGLRPGSIPPFGSLFQLPTWCDDRLAAEETINFNAGDHAVSIRMRFDDYRDVEQPMMGDFGETSE